ncbi:hypothetical protein Taro_050554, partial [Colocasia esculenta]|nr:hypothetical protein [Colocasia esculenta]
STTAVTPKKYGDSTTGGKSQNLVGVASEVAVPYVVLDHKWAKDHTWSGCLADPLLQTTLQSQNLALCSNFRKTFPCLGRPLCFYKGWRRHHPGREDRLEGEEEIAASLLLLSCCDQERERQRASLPPFPSTIGTGRAVVLSLLNSSSGGGVAEAQQRQWSAGVRRLRWLVGRPSSGWPRREGSGGGQGGLRRRLARERKEAPRGKSQGGWVGGPPCAAKTQQQAGGTLCRDPHLLFQQWGCLAVASNVGEITLEVKVLLHDSNTTSSLYLLYYVEAKARKSAWWQAWNDAKPNNKGIGRWIAPSTRVFLNYRIQDLCVQEQDNKAMDSDLGTQI